MKSTVASIKNRPLYLYAGTTSGLILVHLPVMIVVLPVAIVIRRGRRRGIIARRKSIVVGNSVAVIVHTIAVVEGVMQGSGMTFGILS